MAKAGQGLRLGLAEYDSGERSLSDARGLFLRAVVQIEPQVWLSLEPHVRLYRDLFKPSQALGSERSAILTRSLGWDRELADQSDLEAEAAQAGVDKAELEPDHTPPHTIIHWRDPASIVEMGKKLRADRIARGLSVEAEAERLGILPSELREMELGCNLRAGLTTFSGAEPLRRELQRWGKRWHLTDDWCLDWALMQLRTWPPKNPNEPGYHYPLDNGIQPIPTPLPPAYHPQLETRKHYVERVTRYCDEVERVMEAAKLKQTPPAKRRRVGTADLHFYWLAGYQCCGWSENRTAQAVVYNQGTVDRYVAGHIRRSAVIRAIHRLAKEIGLTRRPSTQYDQSWTVERIHRALPNDLSEII